MNEQQARRIVAERAKGRCELCGISEGERPLTFSHRMPKGLGGNWYPSNGLRACGSGTTGCHGWIEHHPADAAAAGWRITRPESPYTSPAFLVLPWPGWWLLDDDGGYLTPDGDRPIPPRLPPQTLARL